MANWTDQELYSGQPSSTYNDASKTYNQVDLQYNGKTQNVWDDQIAN